MPRPRDQQRSKCYAAENVAREAIGDAPWKDRMPMLVFIERVERDKWFRRHYGRRSFTVKDGRGTRRAMAWGYSTISLPRWSRSPLVILHEIAHCCTENDPGHGWKWAATFLRLVRHFMGKDVADVLKHSFRQHRVRFTAPRPKRQLTEQQKAELRERFAKIRAQRPDAIAADRPSPALSIALARANS